jgi:hypothetical protein
MRREKLKNGLKLGVPLSQIAPGKTPIGFGKIVSLENRPC